jgi:hypothetical protein
MTQSQPPALANWMFRHLVPGDKTEALEGDLLEEFQRRRSAAWYWRQVAGAILASLSSELRADWAMAWTIFFIIVWAFCLYAFPIVALPVRMGTVARASHYFAANGFLSPADRLAFSLVFFRGPAFLLQVVMPLAIYLAGVRNLKLRAFTLGLCAAVLVSIVQANVPFQPALDFLSLHGLAMYWTQLWKWYEVFFQFLPLPAAMWAARPDRRETRALPISG